MNTINFRFHEVKCTLLHRAVLKKQLLNLFKSYHTVVDTVDYIFCSDDYLLEINRTYLNHDYYTDIITFDLSTHHILSSEIYISIDRVKENAKFYKSSFQNEIIRVISHGALHLCGLKDKKATDIKTMRLAEKNFINRFNKNVSRPTVSG